MPDDAALTTDVPHPSVFIQEEMDERGWSRRELARRMGGDYRMKRLEIDLYFEVGPDKTNMRLGRTGEDMARAFDVSPEFLRNLEAAWLKSRRTSVGTR
jgi:plasmid maintenance system antidote protein VapI